MQREYIKTSFGKISYIRREGRYPLLMLHGLGGSGNSFLKLNPLINEKMELFMIDLLGHGHSDKPQLNYTIELQEMVISEFLELKGIEHFGIMGNSYGGWISLRLTIDRIKPNFLILEDSAGINITYGEMGEEAKKKFVNMIISNNPGNEYHVLESTITNNANKNWKLKDYELASIKNPALIIWGKDDKIIPPSYGEELNKKIPDSKLYLIENGGHVPHVKKPNEVAKAINDFLDYLKI